MGLKVLALSSSGGGDLAPSAANARDRRGSIISSSKNGLQCLKSLLHCPVADRHLRHGMVRTGANAGCGLLNKSPTFPLHPAASFDQTYKEARELSVTDQPQLDAGDQRTLDDMTSRMSKRHSCRMKSR